MIQPATPETIRVPTCQTGRATIVPANWIGSFATSTTAPPASDIGCGTAIPKTCARSTDGGPSCIGASTGIGGVGVSEAVTVGAGAGATFGAGAVTATGSSLVA